MKTSLRLAKTPLTVLYDISPAVHQRAGLARYAERLARHLLAGQGERAAPWADRRPT